MSKCLDSKSWSYERWANWWLVHDYKSEFKQPHAACILYLQWLRNNNNSKSTNYHQANIIVEKQMLYITLILRNEMEKGKKEFLFSLYVIWSDYWLIIVVSSYDLRVILLLDVTWMRK